jgi:hypothetical protein
MLSNPNTYKAIAIEAGKRGLISLAARMLCRAIKEFARDVVNAIVDGLSGVVAGTLAEAAELAVAMTAAVLTGVSVALNLLEKFWDWLTGKDDDKKKKAEKQIRQTWNQINNQMGILFDRVNDIEKTHLQFLKTGINQNEQLTADWSRATEMLESGEGTENLSVNYTLELLSGQPGDPSGTLWAGTSDITLKGIDQLSYQTALTAIPNNDNYHLNASVYCTLTGIVFANSHTQSTLEQNINKLNKVDDSLAKSFAADLQSKLKRLKTLNKGIQCQPVYATVDGATRFTLGQSRIGLNTRL